VTYTDIYSGWTANRALWNKGATGVVDATRDVEALLPFAALRFDCDNGSERPDGPAFLLLDRVSWGG